LKKRLEEFSDSTYGIEDFYSKEAFKIIDRVFGDYCTKCDNEYPWVKPEKAGGWIYFVDTAREFLTPPLVSSAICLYRIFQNYGQNRERERDIKLRELKIEALSSKMQVHIAETCLQRDVLCGLYPQTTLERSNRQVLIERLNYRKSYDELHISLKPIYYLYVILLRYPTVHNLSADMNMNEIDQSYRAASDSNRKLTTEEKIIKVRRYL